MAHQVPKKHILGNLKSKGLGRYKHENSKFREEREGMSSEHCHLIRQLPCATCDTDPAGTVHHLKQNTKERGMGVRSTDQWGVPECCFCHVEVEQAGTKKETAWYLDRGIDPIELARALWNASGDLEKKRSIVIAFKEQANA